MQKLNRNKSKIQSDRNMKPPSMMKKIITIFIFLGLFITQQAKAQFIRDAEIENLLEDYSNPIFLAAGLKPDEVHIGVINNKSLNAFVAGGKICISTLGLFLRQKHQMLSLG